ncbi:hypothetical protein QBC33DRAFT_623567 [Phialemonium atrogriseum]|uniref:Peptidase S8/S53 domain-containing protein n=1 Tax=Phialemonium atrogriseum TaxID=1093897 RepID=A0AAJ0BTB1_9PEZI|nr:uncharacterized protein QBC33DRAFT_623567 [Phialemonium atrogriseum]KAK1762667.1 hypothetical protein QBC33DRAFT_623567 [Phialemonium atrogriseum]
MSGLNLFSEPGFLLPGVEIRVPGGKEVGGSSFSTAYVAGLAAVMLCFLRAHLELRGEKLERQRRLEFAKSIDGMKTIFKLLGRKDASDRTEGGLFPRPHLKFEGGAIVGTCGSIADRRLREESFVLSCWAVASCAQT